MQNIWQLGLFDYSRIAWEKVTKNEERDLQLRRCPRQNSTWCGRTTTSSIIDQILRFTGSLKHQGPDVG